MKAMKRIRLTALLLALTGCTEKVVIYDTEPPAAPRGLQSITGDGWVVLEWYPNTERDLAGYRIWKRPDQVDGQYVKIANLSETNYTDQNLDYGRTYFYFVTAFDHSGNESPRSELAYDTPRPEGSSLVQDFNLHPSTAGFAFTNSAPYGSVVAWNSGSADIYFEYSSADAAWFINVSPINVNTDLQDMGYTDSFDDVSYSPTSGWSAVGWVEAIVGHTYVVWTADDHYAKIRITSIDNPNSTVYFDWGYQIDGSGLGQLELKPAVIKKPQHDPTTYLRRQITR